MTQGGEFALIAEYLAPLTRGAPGADHLRDDGALLDLSPGESLAVSTDTQVEGRHFLSGTPYQTIAQRALRTSLSDLAAMGAVPFAYMLNLVWPQGGPGNALSDFVEGLRHDQDRFGVRLIGGDTTAGSAAFSVSCTVFGRRPAALSLRRSGARPGDSLVVTGTIGDAGLGLAVAQDRLHLSEAAHLHLTARFERPEPRIEAVQPLRRWANAAIDISDGLLADAGHLARQSGLSVQINLEDLPASPAAMEWVESQPSSAEALAELASFGDDYELALATRCPERLIADLNAVGLAARKVGCFVKDGGETVQLSCQGKCVQAKSAGFTHF